MTVLLKKPMHRRALLRGLLQGAAVTLPLPFLDCILDERGEALAATGQELPIRFGTWYWGMGHTPGHAIREKRQTAPGIEFLEETQALAPYASQMNFFGGFGMPLDGRSNYTHHTGWVGSRTGFVPQSADDIPATTLDLIIADKIGTTTRFRSIDASSAGIARENYSARSAESRGLAEISPVALYTRLFGPQFVDPNSSDFKPNPEIMMEKSVLSAFIDSSADYAKTLGVADRQRMDEYFTSIRQLENQMARSLEKPAPCEACKLPERPSEPTAERLANVREIPNVIETHKVMAKLLAMAVACDQTRVFNMVFTDNFANVRRQGEANTHHLLTHMELIDPNLGYQPTAFWFNQRCSEALATYIETLSGIREGNGTLLDHSLIFASSETNYAKLHTIDGIPIYLIGKAGGRMKTGLHVVGGGDPISRVGLTAMRIMGVELRNWGTKSLQTSKPITDVMA